MQNEYSKFIRQASFDLYSLDNKDVVKVASFLKRFVNWSKALVNPEYRENIEKLKEESPRIKYLADILSEEINKLTSSIDNTDPQQYGDSLSALRPLIAELAKELGAFDATAAEANANAPAEGVIDEKGVLHPESNYLTYVSKGYRENPEIMEKLKNQLPQNLDVPIKQRILEPVQSFNWFKQFSPDDIYISPSSLNVLIGQIKDTLISSINDISAYDVDQMINSNMHDLISNIQSAILNGTLLKYVYPEAGGKFGTRTANQMEMVINAGVINIPNTDLYIELPLVLLNDRYASSNPVKSLEFRMVKGLRFARGKSKQTQKPLSEDLPNIELDAPVEESDKVSTSNFRLNEFVKMASLRRLQDSEITSDLSSAAKKILAKKQPIGSQIPFSINGINYIAKIEEHYHPPGGPRKPWGNHPGVSLFIYSSDKDPLSLIQTSKPSGTKQEVDPVKTKLTVSQASSAIRSAWSNLFGKEPAPETVAILTAQWAHETGNGQSMFNYNFGGIKGVGPSGLTVKQRTREGWGANEKTIRDNFRAYTSAEEGAEDYLKLLRRRYPQAINAALDGNPEQFVRALKKGGYFTGNEDEYIKSVSRRTNQYLGNSSHMQEDPVKKTPTTQTYIEPQTEVQQEEFNADDASDLFNFLYASVGPTEKIVRKAIYKQKLPNTRAFISICSLDVPLYFRVRYAKLLATALRIELDAECSIHNYKSNIEIEADIFGSEKNVLSAVKGISSGISEAFALSIEKCGNYNIETRIVPNVKSSYNLIDKNIVETCFRKFAFDMVGHE